MKNVFKYLAVMTGVMGIVGLARADDPYAGYVQLKADDSGSTWSWNTAGNWSDGQAPHADANYYVPVGKRLYHPHFKNNADTNIWKGGELVIAGTFRDAVGNHPDYAPWIKSITLLAGSHLCVNFFGPFTVYPNSMVKTGGTSESATYPNVRIAGTSANPSKITFEADSGYNGSDPRWTTTKNVFSAESATSVMEISRPHTGIITKKDCPYGFYLRIYDYVFATYGGVVKFTGDRTIFRPEPGQQVKFGQAALSVEDDAEFHLVGLNNQTYNNTTKSALFRQLNVPSGQVYFNCNVASGHAIYPVLEVSEKLSFGADAKIHIPYVTNTLIKGVSSSDPNGKVMKLANLAAGATAEFADGVQIVVREAMPEMNLVLRAIDVGSGKKEVWICAPDVVTMNVDNIESTSGSSVQYGAFDGKHDDNWSTGVTPPPDTTLNCWAKNRLCSFADLDRTNATLTLEKKMTVKGGTRVSFKTFNVYPTSQIAFWNVKKLDFIGETFNLPVSNQTVNIVNNCTAPFRLMADLKGFGRLCLQNQNDQGGSSELFGKNDGFHGKIYLKQYNSGGTSVVTPYKFTVNVADAATLGGTYNAGTPYDGIYLQAGVRMHVTDTTEFKDPTRGLMVDSGKIDVDAGKTLRVSTYFTYYGKLVKDGAGTLDLGGEARFHFGRPTDMPESGKNELEIWKGDLKVSSQKALDGVQVTFKKGTRLVLDRTSQYGLYNVRWATPLVIEDKLLLVCDGLTHDCPDLSFDLPIATMTVAAAQTYSKDQVRLSPGTGYRIADVWPRVNADNSVTLVATVEKAGLSVIVR